MRKYSDTIASPKIASRSTVVELSPRCTPAALKAAAYFCELRYMTKNDHGQKRKEINRSMPGFSEASPVAWRSSSVIW
ncbi:MAG: hypothetical protein IT374_17120 [Polyangiaceae bacterium]|nr:hypothetical protein [Polyangiaceae bacterium]